QRARAVMRADEDHVTLTARDEADAAEDEGPHDELAQLRVRLDDGAQRAAGHLEHLAVLGGTPADQAAPPGEHAHLAGELPRSQRDDRVLAAVSPEHDLEGPPEDHVEPGVPGTLLEEHLTPVQRSAGSEPCETVDLLRRERGEQLPAALFEWIRSLGHGGTYWPPCEGGARASPAEGLPPFSPTPPPPPLL